MGNIDFFTTWVLWQQMTFVLACAILLTFFAGLGKLWWINRSVRKHELLDEEKKSRMEEIEKVGIPTRKRPEIPFGVRAIQSGIEVDGIWISRPGTPNSQMPLGASLLSLASQSDSKGKSKVTSEVVTPTSHQSSSSSSIIETSTSRPISPAQGPQTTYRPKHAPRQSSARATRVINAESLNKLEGTSVTRPVLQTYIPRSSFSLQPKTQTGRNSSSSDEATIPSPQSSTQTRTRKNSPSPDLMKTEKGGYFTPDQSSPENPFATPRGGRTRQGSDASSFRLPSSEQTRALTPPQRSYSGETHVNRMSRRVNAGFEVLPAGTFGPDPPANGNDIDLERGDGPSGNKRSSRSVAQKFHKKGGSN